MSRFLHRQLCKGHLKEWQGKISHHFLLLYYLTYLVAFPFSSEFPCLEHFGESRIIKQSRLGGTVTPVTLLPKAGQMWHQTTGGFIQLAPGNLQPLWTATNSAQLSSLCKSFLLSSVNLFNLSLCPSSTSQSSPTPWTIMVTLHWNHCTLSIYFISDISF